MKEFVFYPNSKKPGPVQKLFSFFLLAAGASSVLDIEYLKLSNRIYYKIFMQAEQSIDYSDADILYKNGTALAISGTDDNFSLKSFDNPNEIAAIIEEHKIKKDSPVKQ